MAAVLFALRGPPRVKEAALASRPSDEELVGSLRRGENWAKEAVYRRHFSLVWSTALRLLENRSDAEDVLQDTFARAFHRIQNLRDPEAPSGWLVQIAVRLVYRRFRRRKLLRALGLESGADDATLASLSHPGLSPEARAELSMLEGVLRGLPVAERLAWMLRYVEGYSLDEVARACSCSLATAKRRIRAADARVRQHVDVEEVVR